MATYSSDAALAHDAAAAPIPGSRPRLWPALALVGAYWIAWAIVNGFYSATFTQFLVLFWSPFLLTAGILVWWLALSRLRWGDRFWGMACLVGGGIGAAFLIHKSMAMGLIMYAAPVAITAVVLAVALMKRAAKPARWSAVAIASVLAWGYFTLIRVDGITGALQAQRSWRWSATAEDTFLAQRKKRGEAQKEATDAAPVTMVATAADWPAFRGASRDGHLLGVDLTGDWTAQPPRELWRTRVGPGWSSLAVVGERVYTQEQRGEMEAVVCLSLATGKELWSHEDQSRFYEVVAGAGPRATPTFEAGNVYSLGGGGLLNCLDAGSGRKVWSRDITADAKAKESDAKIKPPAWGFSSSPLVAQGIATVFAGGKEGKSVLGYDAASGELRWSAGQGTHSYSSPQLVTIAGQEQVLMVSEYGLEAFEPATGRLLWEHKWNEKDVFRVCQPHVVGDNLVLLGTGMSFGTRLLEIGKEGDEWKITEKWTSKDLKPYFNDFVSLGGFLYGFDNDILVCIDLATGKKRWKKGRYGHGQVLLVGDQGQLLVISDQGEVVLTEVGPSGLVERGRFQAINGKTWNHPVIAAGKLLVRNGEEMACYELPNSSQITANKTASAE